jgi:hypothetical protein
LLALTNTSQDDKADTDHVLHAFDLTTGTKHWEQPITRVESTPWIVDGTIVLLSGSGMRDELGAYVLFIDAKSGKSTSTAVAKHMWRDWAIGQDDILLRCEGFDTVCRASLDPANKPSDDWLLKNDWLARVDFKTRTLTPVTLADGSLKPLSFGGDRLARYNDMILESSVFGGWLLARRLGDATPAWTIEGARVAGRKLDRTMEHAPHAAYLHRVPGRYLPQVVDGEDGTRIVVIDVQTGAPTWKSEPLPLRRDDAAFVVHGTRYYVNVVLGGANTLLEIDATSGKFVSAWQIVVGDESGSPNALGGFHDQVDPRYFHAGRLLGHRFGPEWWMIDLQSGSLVASPGVELASRWDDAERVLGPLPRAFASR